MKVKYRNTGFIRQLFLFHKGYYRGVEIGRGYIRYYTKALEGTYGKYKEVRL